MTDRPFNTIYSKYCTKCGTCVGVCPADYLELEVLPDGEYQIKETLNKCNNCGKCFDICPINLEEKDFEDVDYKNKTYLLGNVISIYKAHAEDPQLRYRATSGGVVSTLLLELLKKKLIDAAFLVKFKKDNSPLAVPFIGFNEEDVLSSVGSKYQQVPLNILLKQKNKFRSVAVVGLPCHIRALDKYMSKTPVLSKKVKVKLGLVCSHTMRFSALQVVAKKYGINSIGKVSYRGNGWPGKLRIRSRDNQKEKVVGSIWQDLFRTYLFSPQYCLYCPDHLNEKSDISFADAWLPEELTDKNNPGKSIIIIRSESGKQLVEMLKDSGKIVLENCSENQLMQAQLWPLYFKKKRILVYLFFRNARLGNIGRRIRRSNILDFLIAYWTYCNATLSKRKFFHYLITIAPNGLLAKHRIVFERVLNRAVKNFYREIEK